MKYLKKVKKLEDKQLTTGLINHYRKQQEFFEGGKKKGTMKNKLHIVRAVAVPNLNTKEKKKKRQKTIKDIMTMMIKVILIMI